MQDRILHEPASSGLRRSTLTGYAVLPTAPASPTAGFRRFVSMFLIQRMEHDDFVEAVQKLRPESAAEFRKDGVLHPAIFFAFKRAAIVEHTMAPYVGRHDHDNVFEIDRSSLPVSQTPIVQAPATGC